jgi:ABC-type multidrug transport system ATPase subunit
LDHETRDQLDSLIGRAVEQGATVLIASHELYRAESLAHRVVELGGGMTVAPARPAPGVPSAEMPVSRTQERKASSPSPSAPEVSHVA